VNRDIEQRIRTVDAISNHMEILRNDIRNVSKIINIWDKRWSLWQFDIDRVEENPTETTDKDKVDSECEDDDDSNCKNEEETKLVLELPNQDEANDINGNNPEMNPLVVDLDDYIAEEVIGSKSEEEKEGTFKLKDFFDTKLAAKLDILILYLRIVHSIDYYNAQEYQQEDLMPNRCGQSFS
jgi:hypothetical protein